MPTELKNVWIRDAEGVYASVAPADVDNWKPRGWELTDVAPTRLNEDQVWLQHDVHGGKAKFAQEVVETWGALGWKPSAPPEPRDLTKDPVLVDVPEDEPVAESKPKKSTKAASGGSTEES